MKRISSNTTFLYKRIFPLFWFGIVAGMAAIILFTSKSPSAPPFSVLIFPILMGAMGYFIMKKTVWDLADEVLDAGDSLVVRFGSEEEQIPLFNIVNVSYSYMMNPARVTLTLRTPGRFGEEVSFSPPQRLIPFTRSPIVLELIQRVDRARRTSV